MPSFDVVSRVEMHEITNAINQAQKELGNRYDFRGSKSSIEQQESTITVVADDDMKLKAMKEIINQKMAKRGVGLRSLEYKEPEPASGGMLRQKIEIKEGISQDDGKKIVKLIKEKKLKKVQAQIQQDQVRITGPKKDVLQDIISLLKDEIPLELQFVNFKD